MQKTMSRIETSLVIDIECLRDSSIGRNVNYNDVDNGPGFHAPKSIDISYCLVYALESNVFEDGIILVV